MEWTFQVFYESKDHKEKRMECTTIFPPQDKVLSLWNDNQKLDVLLGDPDPGISKNLRIMFHPSQLSLIVLDHQTLSLHLENKTVYWKDTDRRRFLFPITFSIPECHLVDAIPDKTKMMSHMIPGKKETYIYNTQKEYYHEYQTSMFALTHRKEGWDCMRHYEIIANGCIPFFPDIETCPPKILSRFPKSLVVKGNAFYHRLSKKTPAELSQEENR